MRVNPIEHKKQHWVVHELLDDFKIEDVWSLPVILDPKHSISLIQDQFSKTNKNIEVKGLAAWLFRLRLFLGRLFNWDKKIPRTGLVPGSIRERYAKAKALVFEQLPDPGDGNYVPVYNLSEESLAEIENATVHAAIHLGRVPLENNRFTAQMTIYVKPKGILGHLYMLLIKPFRLFIVYPALLNTIKTEWELYLKSDVHNTIKLETSDKKH